VFLKKEEKSRVGDKGERESNSEFKGTGVGSSLSNLNSGSVISVKAPVRAQAINTGAIGFHS
jgi:hypothetical protein